MESEGADIGREVEAAVANLCTSSFFPDFVVRSPKYRKKGGQEKEAADVLVAVGDTALVIQVKTRILPWASTESFSDVEEGRFLRIIGKGLDQFRALLEAIQGPTFGSLINDHGLPLEFRKGIPKKLFLIVVYSVVMPDGSQPKINIRCSKSCNADGPIPIHIFALDQFQVLLRLLNTFPDFANYLELRGNLQETNLISKMADPVDVWALITFEYKRVTEALNQETMLDIDGLWLTHEVSLAQLESREHTSYFIDWLIRELHASSGIVMPFPDYLNKYLQEPPGSVEAYQRIVPYLAQLDRKQRTKLSEELLVRIARSQDGGDSFGAVKFEQHAEAYLILCSVNPRQDWHLSLHNLGLGLAHTLQVSRVICIATGMQGPLDAGCAVMIVEAEVASPSPEIIARAREWFGPPREERLGH